MFDGWLETKTGFVLVVLAAVLLMHLIRARGRRVRAETRRQVQLALLSKFESSEEMVKFLGSSEGSRFLDELAEPTFQADPRRSALRLAILGCIGLGVTAARWWEYSATGDAAAQSAFMNFGGASLGFLLAAGACIVLSRALGIAGNERA